MDTIEANELFDSTHDIVENMRGSRYARFFWLQQINDPQNLDSTWAEHVARRMTQLHASEGFVEAFAFEESAKKAPREICSSWTDARAMRTSKEKLPSPKKTVDKFAQITSSNTA